MRSRWSAQLAAVAILVIHTVVADRLHEPHAATTGAYVQQRGELADARGAWQRQRRLLFSEKDHTDLYTVRAQRDRAWSEHKEGSSGGSSWLASLLGTMRLTQAPPREDAAMEDGVEVGSAGGAETPMMEANDYDVGDGVNLTGTLIAIDSLATGPDGPVHETKAEKAARSTRRGKIVRRAAASADDVFTHDFAVEHGRWMLSVDGWLFVASNSCSANTSTEHSRTYACAGVGADTRLRDMLGIPLGDSSPNDEEVWEWASKVSHWRGNLDQKHRAVKCNSPSHPPPFWCKTEAGPAGALIRDMDATEAKWLQAALKREKLKHNMLEVLHIKDRIVDAQVDANAEFAAKTAALQEERKQLVERLKTVDAMLEQTRKQQVEANKGVVLAEEQYAGLNDALKGVEREEASSWGEYAAQRKEVHQIRRMGRVNYQDYTKLKSQVQEQRDKLAKAQARAGAGAAGGGGAGGGGTASSARAEADKLKAMEAALGAKLREFARGGAAP